MTRTALARLSKTVAALAMLSLPLAGAHAADTAKGAGKMIYNMVGAMIVDGATKGEGFGLNADGPYITQDRYSAEDALNNQSYSPADGVNCYPKQGLCFKSSGQIDNKWTSRIYAD